jgi:hypothetical protein
MTKRGFEKLWRVRNKILTNLDRTGWVWNPVLSDVLCQIDCILWRVVDE